jgi:hypothetical protein
MSSSGLALSGIFAAPKRWPFGNDPAYLRAYSPLGYIHDPLVTATARQQFWFLGAALNDGVYYAIDDAFARLGIPHVTKYWPGGHSWHHWGQMLGEALPRFDQGFSAPGGTYVAPPGPPESWPGNSST